RRAAVGEDRLEARIVVLRLAETDQLALRERAPAMHRRVDAARQRWLAREAEAVHVVRRVPIPRRVERLNLDARAVLGVGASAELPIGLATPAAVSGLEGGIAPDRRARHADPAPHGGSPGPRRGRGVGAAARTAIGAARCSTSRSPAAQSIA